MINKIMPPAKRNAGMVMPNKDNTSLPLQSVISIMTNMAIVASTAVLRCSMTDDLRVNSRNMESEPRGFIIMTMATINWIISGFVILIRSEEDSVGKEWITRCGHN